MCVNIGLVKMDVEANDVLFAEAVGNKGIHIFCPFLDVIVPCQVGVISTLVNAQCLVSESEFVHTFSAPTKDKLGQRVLPTADILFSRALGSFIPRAARLSAIFCMMDFDLSIGWTMPPRATSKFK